MHETLRDPRRKTHCFRAIRMLYELYLREARPCPHRRSPRPPALPLPRTPALLRGRRPPPSWSRRRVRWLSGRLSGSPPPAARGARAERRSAAARRCVTRRPRRSCPSRRSRRTLCGSRTKAACPVASCASRGSCSRTFVCGASRASAERRGGRRGVCLPQCRVGFQRWVLDWRCWYLLLGGIVASVFITEDFVGVWCQAALLSGRH